VISPAQAPGGSTFNLLPPRKVMNMEGVLVKEEIEISGAVKSKGTLVVYTYVVAKKHLEMSSHADRERVFRKK
jgi:hypothetical protein